MIAELGLAAGMLGKIFDLTQSGKAKKSGDTDAAAGVGDFSAMMAQAGIQMSTLPTAGASRSETVAVQTDGMDADTKAAWNMLKDMTSGGLEGAMRAAMQKLRDKVMQRMGVTDEALSTMDPGARSAMEAKIAEEMQKQIQEAMGADGKVTPEEQMMGGKLLEMAKAYKSDVPVV